MNRMRNWAGLGLFLAVAVFAAGWFLMVKPQKAQQTKYRDQASQQLQANQQVQEQIALLKKQQAQLPAEQASIAAINARVPDSPALPAYVRTIEQLATASHLELVSISPSPPAPAQLQAATAAPAAPAASGSAGATTAPTAAGGSTTAPVAAGPPLMAIPVVVDVVGDYFAVEQFLSQLEQATRATVVTSIHLQPGKVPAPTGNGAAGGADQTSWRTLDAQVSLAIFQTNASPAPAAAGAVTAPASAGAAATTAPSAAPSPTSTAANN